MRPLETTNWVSGFATGMTLRVRKPGEHSVLVWRNNDGVWCWSVIGWTEHGLSWRRISGRSPSWLQAVGDGLAEMDTQFRSLL